MRGSVTLGSLLLLFGAASYGSPFPEPEAMATTDYQLRVYAAEPSSSASSPIPRSPGPSGAV